MVDPLQTTGRRNNLIDDVYTTKEKQGEKERIEKSKGTLRTHGGARDIGGVTTATSESLSQIFPNIRANLTGELNMVGHNYPGSRGKDVYPLKKQGGAINIPKGRREQLGSGEGPRASEDNQ